MGGATNPKCRAGAVGYHDVEDRSLIESLRRAPDVCPSLTARRNVLVDRCKVNKKTLTRGRTRTDRYRNVLSGVAWQKRSIDILRRLSSSCS